MKKATEAKQIPLPGVVQWVNLGDLRPNPWQPRTHRDEVKFCELVESIEKHQLYHNLLGRFKEGVIEVADGHQRWEAYKVLQAKTPGRYDRIPVDIREILDQMGQVHKHGVGGIRDRVEGAALIQTMVIVVGLDLPGEYGKAGFVRSRGSRRAYYVGRVLNLVDEDDRPQDLHLHRLPAMVFRLRAFKEEIAVIGQYLVSLSPGIKDVRTELKMRCVQTGGDNGRGRIGHIIDRSAYVCRREVLAASIKLAGKRGSTGSLSRWVSSPTCRMPRRSKGDIIQ